ncbi:hypothetical protein ACFSFZ_01670 [Mixta tenebrionis]|uniref:hypothetical protein n=1 Tax=Mixta tenebrionis TaxID=2562439 RepID=UPI0013634552|nr:MULTISPECIES: hypothetical protein [Mixta]QHM77295.1 hypothetical protein C7M52_03291 [Mixta theicola]
MKYKICALIALLIAAYSIFYVFSSYRNERYFSCLAQHHVHNNNVRSNMLMRFIFNGDTGMVSLDGEFINEQGHHKIISRKIIFDFTIDKKNYLLNSRMIIPSVFDEIDEHTIPRLLDNFYTQERRPAVYQIHYNGKGGYIFMNDNAPYLLCASN